ncbi:Gustatory receptor 182 [Halyomorpha halys]|nr:Gustatory receptor 182 [Halyomorpha halys]
MAEEFVRLAVNQRLWLGKYLLLFPYNVKGKKFQTTLPHKLLCWVAAIVLVGCCIWGITIFNMGQGSFSFLFWAPMLTSYLNLLINQAWMHLKKPALDNFLSDLQKCRPYLKMDDDKAMIKSSLPILFIFMVYLGFWALIPIRYGSIEAVSIVLLYSQLGYLLGIAMMEQFILLLSLVRHQLRRTPLLSDTEQDALIAAAVDLNEVFSPHLLVGVMTILLSQLGKMYHAIIGYDNVNVQDFVIVALQSFPIWRVVLSCQQFAKEVDEFYNRTYSRLLAQRYRIQKRMELHLGMREKFAFSACGMFDLDYAFLRGMLTSFTTIVVVLLQFTPNK